MLDEGGVGEDGTLAVLAAMCEKGSISRSERGEDEDEDLPVSLAESLGEALTAEEKLGEFGVRLAIRVRVDDLLLFRCGLSALLGSDRKEEKRTCLNLVSQAPHFH